jgi:hypothetical protein
MTVAEWSKRFFEVLERELGITIDRYESESHPCGRIDDAEVRIVGCDDCFMSVWYEGAGSGPILDEEPTIETAGLAATDTAEIIRTLRNRR